MSTTGISLSTAAVASSGTVPPRPSGMLLPVHRLLRALLPQLLLRFAKALMTRARGRSGVAGRELSDDTCFLTGRELSDDTGFLRGRELSDDSCFLKLAMGPVWPLWFAGRFVSAAGGCTVVTEGVNLKEPGRALLVSHVTSMPPPGMSPTPAGGASAAAVVVAVVAALRSR